MISFGKVLFRHSIVLGVLLHFLFASLQLNAQQKQDSAKIETNKDERKLIREGNNLYNNKKYSDAEIRYRKSLEKNKNSTVGSYNLGNTLYKEGKYDEAISRFNQNSDQKMPKDLRAKNLHNLGNAYMQAEKYEDAVNAFKNSLKANPEDKDTRYNLAYAMSKLQQQQQQQQQQKDNKDNKDNKDQKDKQQQQGKDKDQKDKQQQQQQQQQKEQKEQEQKQAQQKQQKISKEDAERMLQALKNDEQKLQKRMNMKEGERVRISKNW